MIIENFEALKKWLTKTLTPVCEADPAALAKYVVALVKKDKPLPELREFCMDQLDVFLQSKTKDFVELLFEALESKNYIAEFAQTVVPPVVPLNEIVVPIQVSVIPVIEPVGKTSDIVPDKEDVKPEEVKDQPIKDDAEPRQAQSYSPKLRSKELDDRRKRFDDRSRIDDRRLPRRRSGRSSRSPSPRNYAGRARSPGRRSPLRPIHRGYSPRRRPLRRSWSRSRSRSPRIGSPIRSPRSQRRSRSPMPRNRTRSGSPRLRRSSKPRSTSPRPRSRSPRPRSKSPRSRSPGPRLASPILRSRSPRPRSRTRSRSPRNRSGSPRPRSRTPRSRSRSPRYSQSPRPHSLTPRSRSRSRSWSPRRVHSPDSRGPTPTQDNGPELGVQGESAISVVTHTNRGYDSRNNSAGPRLRRCQDYDEKGFCMRGDLCPYDHGTDPVVVEDVSIPPPVPFHMQGPPPPPGVMMRPGMGPSIPPPHLGPPPHGPGFMPPRHHFHGPPPLPHMLAIRSLPPPPPPPPPPSFDLSRPEMQEGYNPESPGMNMVSPPYWPGGPGGPSRPPGLPPLPEGFQPHLGPPPSLHQTPRRELVRVNQEPELKGNDSKDASKDESPRTVVPPKRPFSAVSQEEPLPPGVSQMPDQKNVQTQDQRNFQLRNNFKGQQNPYGPPPAKRPFDFNRIGGYRRPGMNNHNCTLEVKNIPRELNNISKINEHFSKFGTLTNVQVCYEGRQDSALVTFSTNQEAHSAYKSSEPVFNNRFVKVFWHNKEKPAENDANAETSGPNSSSGDTGPPSMRGRLGPLPPAHKMQLNNKLPKPMSEDSLAHTPTVSQDRSIVYASSVGNITKTVYNPEALKTKATLSSPTAVKASDIVSKMEAMKKQETLKQEAALKKLEIQKQKQQLLEKQIEQQKLLIQKLEKNKNMSAEDKTTLKGTLKTLTDSIDKLKAELLGRKVLMSPLAVIKTAEQTRKEMLDTELELMNKQKSGEDVTELKKKLAELQKEAIALGLIGQGRGHGRGRGRGSTTWVAAKVGGGRGMRPGRGRAMSKREAINMRTLDRRPKQLNVKGFKMDDKDEFSAHFMTISEVENIEFDEANQSAVVTFKTRKDAEKAILRGIKFKTSVLQMRWHVPTLNLSRVSSLSDVTDDLDAEVSLDDIDEDVLLGAEEEEEEEEDEERSWRR
ncbi:hypothetical protein ACJMK2_033244 [Sinanodonta woodiana]|uniref:RNA-binding protein 26 n=1 Tax=Sinanodonta woodiana TaxID=1069815 RepID=A0ABD3X454_SINWO